MTLFKIKAVYPWYNDSDSMYKQICTDSLTTVYIGDRPYTAVARGINNGDGTYTIVYADNDALVMENVSTNIGLADYTLEELENMTLRELAYCAFNLDQANMDNQAWLNELLFCVVATS
jgi:hypothetical protein